MALQSRSVAISLCLWLCLSSNVQARPFALLSGPDSLPDDDLDLSDQADASEPFHASFGQANLARAEDGGPIYVVATPTAPPYARLLKGTTSKNRWGLPVQSAVVPPPPAKTVEQLLLDRFGSGKPAQELVKPAHVTADAGEVTALSAAKIQRVAPVEGVSCHDATKDIVIESGLQGNADVFSGGQATPAWATASRTPYVLPSTEQVAVFVVRTGQYASLSRPRVSVSDPSVLTVELAERKSSGAMPDDEAVVFVSKHICKRAGFSTVTIELPLQKARSEPSCPGLPAPAVFSYQKACPATMHTVDTFNRALSVKLPEKDKVLAMRAKVDGMPWHGIIPSGGMRAILGVFLAMGLCIMIYEFGTYWLSNKIKATILEMGPVMLGCDASIDHVALSFWFGHMTYTIQGLKFANPPGVACQKEFFMKIDEVKLWFNLYKLITTCGKEIEIKQLVARHIQANVEIDGYVFGESNISKVMVQMEKNNKQWIADLAAIKDNHGIDAAQLWNNFETWIKQVAERVTLQEVVMEGIGYSASNKALGIEMKIADMVFHDFTAQHDAVGMTAISYYLTHAVLEGMAEDIGGVELGHGRFEGIVNSLKSWTGAAPA